MKTGDDEYNRHFHGMVLDGLAMGLIHPREWLLHYERGIARDHSAMRTIYEFVALAEQEFRDEISPPVKMG